jgi:hypothetical protein
MFSGFSCAYIRAASSSKQTVIKDFFMVVSSFSD